MKIRVVLGTVALVALAFLLRFGDVPEGATVLDQGWNDSPETGSSQEPAPPRNQKPREPTPEPRSIGFAGGIPSDTTGLLLPRDFPAADPSLVSRYYLYLPRGVDQDREWPLILYLHGRSLRGSNLEILTRYGLPARLQHESGFPFIVVAPQLPGGESWTDTDRLARLVEEIASHYPVDRRRVYLIGYSMGAGGVWRTAIDHPEMFAAAAPTAAWTPDPDPSVARALRDLPVRIDHGTADEVAPFERAEAMAEALERAGVDVTFEVYPGADHGELTRIYEKDDLFAWLLAHRRDRAR